jgi:hypothetical protein
VPIKSGDIIIKDILNTGIDLVACKDIDKWLNGAVESAPFFECLFKIVLFCCFFIAVFVLFVIAN